MFKFDIGKKSLELFNKMAYGTYAIRLKRLRNPIQPPPQSPHLIQSYQEYKDLYPKWNCPKCGDWFHLPYKDCVCNSNQKKDWTNVTEKK